MSKENERPVVFNDLLELHDAIENTNLSRKLGGQLRLSMMGTPDGGCSIEISFRTPRAGSPSSSPGPKSRRDSDPDPPLVAMACLRARAMHSLASQRGPKINS